MAISSNDACFCKRDIMSTCTAHNHLQQMNCRFYTKSSFKNKCMYFIASIEAHCASPEAQKAAMNVSEDKTIAWRSWQQIKAST